MKALIITTTKTFEKRFRNIYKFVDGMVEKFGGFVISPDKEGVYDIIIVFDKEVEVSE